MNKTRKDMRSYIKQLAKDKDVNALAAIALLFEDCAAQNASKSE